MRKVPSTFVTCVFDEKSEFIFRPQKMVRLKGHKAAVRKNVKIFEIRTPLTENLTQVNFT